MATSHSWRLSFSGRNLHFLPEVDAACFPFVCIPQGDPCDEDADCCDLECDAATGTCSAPLPSDECVEKEGAGCSSDSDCSADACGLQCIDTEADDVCGGGQDDECTCLEVDTR